MSKRMPASTFKHLQSEFPGELICLEIELNWLDAFKYPSIHIKRKSRKLEQKTDNDRYSAALLEILEWLDENCTHPYFPKVKTSDKWSFVSNTKIQFYFTDDSDALMFKLSFDV